MTLSQRIHNVGSAAVATARAAGARVLMAVDPKWGRRNDGPPDLDELLRNFNRRLSGWFGKRGGNNDSGSGGSGGSLAGGGALVLSLVLLVWVFSGTYIVDVKQRAVVLRFGKFVQEVGDGLHWHLPYPIESAQIVDVSQLRSVEVGFRDSAKMPHESLMLTDDENIVDVQFTVQYRLTDASKFLFNNRFNDDGAADTVRQVAETAVREVVGRSTMNFVLYEGRAQVTDDARKIMQQILDRYQTGIIINQVTMQNAQPPEAVQDAFADVVKAGQDRDRQKNEGEAYANTVVPAAAGTASRLTLEAEGYRTRVMERAEGDASRFRQIVTEYNKAPEVTRERLYLEAMEDIMRSTSKVVVDQKTGNGLIYLPLDKLMQQVQGSASPSGAPAAAVPAPAPPANDGSGTLTRSRDLLRSREAQ